MNVHPLILTVDRHRRNLELRSGFSKQVFGSVLLGLVHRLLGA